MASASGGRSDSARQPAAGLIELKLAAGRARDESDVVELMRANLDHADAIRQHLSTAHTDYVAAFDRLLKRAIEQRDD